MNIFHEDQAAWLAQTDEPVIEPEREIIDPHHHLWPDMLGHVYNLEDFAEDVGSGHRVTGTVFMECGAAYREAGPDHLKSLGETEYVLEQARRAGDIVGAVPILGMVGRADLAAPETLDEVLDRHLAIAGDFFKGIRHAGASPRDADREHLLIPGSAPADLYDQASFRAGVRRLGSRGLSYDTWQYHYQLRDFIALAVSCSDTLLVLDHFSTPLGVGGWATERDAVFERWKAELRELSRCDNVVLKLGGLAMPDNGFGWHVADTPPDSDQLLDAQRDWYLHALDCFGAQRCMFESNFPVDRMSLSYRVYWNAMKKLVAGASEDEKTALFSGTARRVYRLAS